MDNEKQLKIVDAVAEDATIASWLMYLAFGDLSEYLFGTRNLKNIQHYFRKLWIDYNNRFSYRFSHVVRLNNKPVALLSTSNGALTTQLFLSTFFAFIRINPGLIKYALRHLNYLFTVATIPEAKPDEYYIFMLAVLPEYQNKKIGSKLLDFAAQKAKENGFKKVSLLVSAENLNAIRFYERNGFKKVELFDRKPINNFKMLKEI